MQSTRVRNSAKQESGEYFVLPEQAIELLPTEWQEHVRAMLDDGRAILAAVDSDITNLCRLVGAFPAMASLRYVHSRLANTTFDATTEWYFEHEMLTAAFAVAYSRVVEGGAGSGVSRKALPAELRQAHDEIIELRNKRFAHNAGHDSLEGMLEVQFGDGRFDVGVKMQLGFYVGGANEWGKLVAFLDGLMIDRLGKILRRLNEKTGHEWKFTSGPTPPWAEPQG